MEMSNHSAGAGAAKHDAETAGENGVRTWMHNS